MYLNAYQKYIDELIDEYGALLERQLLAMVNAKFKTTLKNISSYTQQMCTFSDFKKLNIASSICKATSSACHLTPSCTYPNSLGTYTIMS